MNDIFLSYAREDLERIRPLAEALMLEGLSVFWDKTIPVGATWSSVLSKALKSSRCLFVVWSKNSVRSEWVLEEVLEAQRQGLTIVPILLDAVSPPLGFRHIQSADLSEWDGTPDSPLLLYFKMAIARDLEPRIMPEPVPATMSESSDLVSAEPTHRRGGGWIRRIFDKLLQRRDVSPGLGHKNISAEVPCGIMDRVYFSVTSPPKVAPGSLFIVDLWAHLFHQRQEVIQRAREARPDGEVGITSKGPVLLARGHVLTVNLKMEGLTVQNPEDVILWEGEIGNATFSVLVPETAKEGRTVGIAKISLDGLQIARVDFEIYISKFSEKHNYMPGQENHYNNAFASYASPDRDAVLARIQGIQTAIPQLNIFLDVMSLRSGQFWEEELWKVIPASDIFYLFWSGHARESEWVEKEWHCALKTRGIDFIHPVPLVSPEQVPPPPELASKHFCDWTLAFMRSQTSK